MQGIKEKMNDVYKGLVKWVVDKFEDKVEEFKEFKKIALLEVGESDTLHDLRTMSLSMCLKGKYACYKMVYQPASVSFASNFKLR